MMTVLTLVKVLRWTWILSCTFAFRNDESLVLDRSTGKISYKDFEMLRLFPMSEKEIEIINFLELNVINTWIESNINNENKTIIDVLLNPRDTDHVKNYLMCSSINYKTTIVDLQSKIDTENIDNSQNDDVLIGRTGLCSSQSGMSWTKYHSENVIRDYIECLKINYDTVVQVIEIGRSSENRPLNVLKVGRPEKILKPAIWIDGGMHAREWISPAFTTYMIHEFVENSKKYSSLLDTYDIYILPLANPDGYQYTHTTDRLWRKTRSRNTFTSCIGVDPNRNWGYHWGELGASSNPCSEIYRGPYAFSEPETKAISEFILEHKDEINMYITIHSYGQFILYPWGYDSLEAVDNNELRRIAQIGEKTLASSSSGHRYSIGSSAKLLYPASGGSDDWAKGEANITYSYTIELPDTGTYGFTLPANQILKVSLDTLKGIIAMIEAL